MEKIEIKKGLIANIVRRTDVEVELDTGISTNYIVCSNGDVISTNYNGTKQSKKLTSNILRGGYYFYLISSPNCKTHSIVIHRLVALCFIPNPNNYPQVNHIDENKSNNDISNLEWCTAKYNSNHGSRNKIIARALSYKVKQLTLDGELVTVWPAAIEAGRNGYTTSAITACCRGENKSHKGFKWEYLT